MSYFTDDIRPGARKERRWNNSYRGVHRIKKWDGTWGPYWTCDHAHPPIEAARQCALEELARCTAGAFASQTAALIAAHKGRTP